MYQQQKSGWLKHWDFAILDIICLEFAFVISVALRQWSDSLYNRDMYHEFGVMFFVFGLIVSLSCKPYSGVLYRDFLQEFFATVSYVSMVLVCQLVFQFIFKYEEASRVVLLATWALSIVLVVFVRSVRKKQVLQSMEHTAQKRAVVLLVGQENAAHVFAELTKQRITQYEVTAILFLDETPHPTLQEQFAVPLVYGRTAAISFLTHNVVDELFVRLPNGQKAPEDFMNACKNAGITVHLGLARKSEFYGKQSLEMFGDYYVLTSSIRVISPWQAAAKRIMDILGGIVGLCLAAIITLFVGPAIYFASPGPIFFSQMRIGRNGRTFKFYKFRSMYMDAEARKAELMAQNKMKGLMFKIDDDPRIIKGVGHFIRKTSLDEFPQFWNVLRGDMSLVGTRPPTKEEYAQYELNHKSRLAFKPGITGLWQISGRSDIVDFEEVIRLDTQYIESWTIFEDIRILMQTVLIVLKQKGSE